MASFMDRFNKFLGKHTPELNAVAGALQVIANYVPMERADRLVVGNAVSTLVNGAGSIAASLDAGRALAQADYRSVGDMGMTDLQTVIDAAVAAALAKAAEVAAQRQQEAIDAAVKHAVANVTMAQDAAAKAQTEAIDRAVAAALEKATGPAPAVDTSKRK